MEWALFVLTYLFGYFTCKAFYFLNATRSSFRLIKTSQLISLGIIVRGIEHYAYSKIYRAEKMRDSKESSHNIMAFIHRHEDELSVYKQKAITEIVECHSKAFKPLLEFDDWDSSMLYLNKYKEFMAQFLSIDKEQ